MKYIDPQYSLADFFYLLNQHGVNYVVLRWAESMAKLATEKDIDLLVADNDIPYVMGLLVKENLPGSKQVDLYSTGGLYGSSFRRLPYYPRHLAEQILSNKLKIENLYFVPSLRDQFFSFIFHVVFHKAEKSGLAVDTNDVANSNKSGRYISEINRLSMLSGQAVPAALYLTNLIQLLRDNDWFPSIAWLRRIGLDNSPFLLSLYPIHHAKSATTLFILRDAAARSEIHEQLLSLFRQKNIRVVNYRLLDRRQRNIAVGFIRGGKWDHLPGQLWGGEPYAAYVLTDEAPVEPDLELRKTYPFLTNQNFLDLKLDARQLIENILGVDRINCLHSADDNLEAIEYTLKLFPQLKDQICQPDFSYPATLPVVLKRYPSKSGRSSVELVQLKDRNAVCKIFTPGSERYFRRELYAYHILAKTVDFVPQLLYYTSDSIYTEYVDHDPGSQDSLLQKRLYDVAIIAHQLWEHGVAHLDLHPGNLIVAKSGKLFLVDYEFLYNYEERPVSVFDSYDVTGIVESAAWGIKGKHPAEFISDQWLALTGFTLTDILAMYLPLPVEA
ncbi:AarF/UbiB family protein [Mucilaginibacter sp. Mucisp84]|uniref:AarF/UbiB family protein n=1 Tax=Mucilaginibacter sp. Mucisp84 TaxID=3243058 RepID=UPI0039A667A2